MRRSWMSCALRGSGPTAGGRRWLEGRGASRGDERPHPRRILDAVGPLDAAGDVDAAAGARIADDRRRRTRHRDRRRCHGAASARYRGARVADRRSLPAGLPARGVEQHASRHATPIRLAAARSLGGRGRGSTPITRSRPMSGRWHPASASAAAWVSSPTSWTKSDVGRARSAAASSRDASDRCTAHDLGRTAGQRA